MIGGGPDRLLAQQALHERDLWVANLSANARLGMKAFNHLCGDFGLTLFGKDELGICPHVRAEFTDSAILRAFGAFGDGIFAAPTAVEDDVRRMYDVGVVGREESVRERFYAISVEKRLKHPAVVAIPQAARKKLFRGE